MGVTHNVIDSGLFNDKIKDRNANSKIHEAIQVNSKLNYCSLQPKPCCGKRHLHLPLILTLQSPLLLILNNR